MSEVASNVAADRSLSKVAANARVLVVDDNKVNRLVATKMLLQYGSGLSVDSAESGYEALDALAEKNYDLILMDVSMPGMDGLETTTQLRAQEREKQVSRVPIVALTAHAMAGDRERFIAAGMDDYIAKPLRRDDLRVVLDDWLPAPADITDGKSGLTPQAEAGVSISPH